MYCKLKIIIGTSTDLSLVGTDCMKVNLEKFCLASPSMIAFSQLYLTTMTRGKEPRKRAKEKGQGKGPRKRAKEKSEGMDRFYTSTIYFTSFNHTSNRVKLIKGSTIFFAHLNKWSLEIFIPHKRPSSLQNDICESLNNKPSAYSKHSRQSFNVITRIVVSKLNWCTIDAELNSPHVIKYQKNLFISTAKSEQMMFDKKS